MNSLLARDVQVKNMEQTIQYAEKHLGEICCLLASYTRKMAKLRDKADMLVDRVLDFSRTENSELHVGLKELAEDLAMVQDYRQAQVERLEMRVVAPLKAYGDIIKNKRADLKKFHADLKRELKELKKLDKIRLKNPADRQSIAEVNAQKASSNAQHSARQLENAITDFQRQKLEDVKRIFSDFVTVEMLFHAKSLEVYTHTHHNLAAINTEKDMELFSGRIRMSDSPATPVSRSAYPSPLLANTTDQSFQSTRASTSGQNQRRHIKHPGGGRSHKILQRQRYVEEDVEVEEEEEEEEQEEEEMNESGTEEGQQTSRPVYAAPFARMDR